MLVARVPGVIPLSLSLSLSFSLSSLSLSPALQRSNAQDLRELPRAVHR